MRFLKRINKLECGNALIELILITVGLFMAIQLENWRENRKEKQLEHKLLTEIRTSLEYDLDFLAVISARVQNAINSSEVLLNHIYNRYDYHDSIQKHLEKLTFGIEFEPRTSAFENLKTVGINLISNDNLRIRIVELYDFEYDRTLRIIENLINSYRQRHLLPYMIDELEYRISKNEFGEFTTELSVSEETLYEQHFLNFVTSRYVSFKDTMGRLKGMEKNITQLKEELEAELQETHS